MDYQTYLKVDELLELQTPLSNGPEHDEPLFIIIHQVYELWFKILLHESKALVEAFEQDDCFKANATLKRMRTVMKTLVSQVDILETMTPLQFNSFRDRLDTSSGFQSVQFRQFEFTVGHKNKRFLAFFKEGTRGHKKLSDLIYAPSMYDHFLNHLKRSNYNIPEEVLSRDVSEPHHPNDEIQNTLLKIYKEDPMRAQICEALVDLDEGIQEWRYRHVKMVERTIGSKSGTGGSEGASYLKKTLFKPLFEDLWLVRSKM